MKKVIRLILLTFSLSTLFYPNISFAKVSHNEVVELYNLSPQAAKTRLKVLLRKDQRKISYSEAREIIFKAIDNNNGQVCCVYSDRHCLRTSRVPNHQKMNIEHTWPQSQGARGIAKSDLHHLFPTNSKLNSTRSSYPFCEVVEVKKVMNGSLFGKDHRGRLCFEPPEEHKGNVARSMFYFSIRYGHSIDKAQENVLRMWHEKSPVDKVEIDRHAKIVKHQQNDNLFVTYPDLVDLIDNF